MIPDLVLTTAATSAASSAPVVIAVVSALGGIAATIVTQLFLRGKTTAEATKTSKEGDSALMDSASNFIAQTGEFGTRLMERIANLEGQVSARDERINELERELHELKVEVARHEALRTAITELRTELAKARARAEASEREAAKLEAIIVAAQIPVHGDERAEREMMERHDHLKRMAQEMRDVQNGRTDEDAGGEDETV